MQNKLVSFSVQDWHKRCMPSAGMQGGGSGDLEGASADRVGQRLEAGSPSSRLRTQQKTPEGLLSFCKPQAVSDPCEQGSSSGAPPPAVSTHQPGTGLWWDVIRWQPKCRCRHVSKEPSRGGNEPAISVEEG